MAAPTATAPDWLPDQVIRPADPAEAVAAVRAAAANGEAVLCRGAGTALGWGPPPERCDLVLDTRGLDQVVDHAAGDLVVVAQAGVRLGALNDLVGRAGQRLALDGVPAGSTLGGIVSTNRSGPLRHSFGAPRDLLLGVRVVRPDGTEARSGGRVVKNVAGYDLGKLYAGGFGTLGLLTQVTLRLHPLPAVRAWVTVAVDDPGEAQRRVDAVRHGTLAVTALELDRERGGPVRLAALLEGSPTGVAARSEQTEALLGRAAVRADVADSAPEWWGAPPDGSRAGSQAGSQAGTAVVKLSVLPARVGDLLGVLDTLGASTVRGSPGVGVLRASFGADGLGETLARLRSAVADGGGHAILVDAPPEVVASVDVWGDVDPGALELMRRVKDRFDPERRFSPGRFVGGI